VLSISWSGMSTVGLLDAFVLLQIKILEQRYLTESVKLGNPKASLADLYPGQKQVKAQPSMDLSCRPLPSVTTLSKFGATQALQFNPPDLKVSFCGDFLNTGLQHHQFKIKTGN